MSYKEISFNPKSDFEIGEITNTDEIRELLVRYFEPGKFGGYATLVGYSNGHLSQKCMMTLDRGPLVNMESDGSFSSHDGDDNKVYRYCLVEIIDEKDIDPTTKCKRDEQGLTQQEIFNKICQEQH